ncbi:uncharacterized protein LOC115685963 [Syzygium oleosum]|uniref:uncharacterized protein LOC115685963 n=1 Tax=Syzygium oleosum TaxID=219896 RepID=UPI0011D253ED|nr:uncharacterized protein LOC115685963 [Syzygium oleosum]
MEAPVRKLASSALHRRLLLHHHHHHPSRQTVRPPPFPFLLRRRAAVAARSRSFAAACAHSRAPAPGSSSLNLPSSLSSLHRSSNPVPPGAGGGPPFADARDGSSLASWSRAPATSAGARGGVRGDGDPAVTVVLLGWLGAKRKHLRRYAEWYNSKGFHAVTFLVGVREMLSLDLGRGVEDRIDELANELIAWVSEGEEGGRERCLLFHSFSNTGWLVYGGILERLHCRQDLIEKIKGCVVDSGGAEPFNPKVWAAGFSAALITKSSSSVEGKDTHASTSEGSSKQEDEGMVETAVLAALEWLFSAVLKFPDVERRLTKTVTILSEAQPSCPQLYLYSSADKVMPYESVESFMETQRRMGRKVLSFNFGSSPHVDHYRTFPDLYMSQLENFIKECFDTVNESCKRG